MIDNIINSYKQATGQPAKLYINHAKDTAKMLYTVLLQDGKQTQKDIVSNDVYQPGDLIFDIDTGKYGKVTRVSPILDSKEMAT